MTWIILAKSVDSSQNRTSGVGFVLFVLAFVPLGFLLRLRGFRPLRLELAPGDTTYWIDRNPPGPEPETMARQF